MQSATVIAKWTHLSLAVLVRRMDAVRRVRLVRFVVDDVVRRREQQLETVRDVHGVVGGGAGLTAENVRVHSGSLELCTLFPAIGCRLETDRRMNSGSVLSLSNDQTTYVHFDVLSV